MIVPKLKQVRASLTRWFSAWALIIAFPVALIFWLELSGNGSPVLTMAQLAMLLVTALLALMLLLVIPIAFALVQRDDGQVAEFARTIQFYRSRNKLADAFADRVRFERGCVDVIAELPDSRFYRWAASDDDVRDISQVNASAFKRSVWPATPEQKFDRNIGLWRRNNRSFLIVSDINSIVCRQHRADPDSLGPCFYSCVLPLNELGYRQYLVDAVVGDAGFRPQWIASNGEPAHSVLVFMIARNPRAQMSQIIGQWSTTPFFLNAVAWHIQQVVRLHFPAHTATIYFQNSSPAFASLAANAGFDTTRLLTADGETVYETELCLRFSDE